MSNISMPALRRAAFAGFTVLAMYAAPSFAQTPPPADAESSEPAARDGQRQNRAPELNLQASASSDVKQDTVTIVLFSEVEAASQAATGKQLTAALDALVKRAKGQDGIDVRTGNYRVYANTNDKGKITSWRGRAELRLESKDFAAASSLASKLSDKSAISNMYFSLSRQGREAEEKKLLNQAAVAFKDRALDASRAFGFSGYRIGKLALGGSGASVPEPRAMMAAMSMRKDSADTADVPLEPDTELVSIEVTGTIILQ